MRTLCLSERSPESNSKLSRLKPKAISWRAPLRISLILLIIYATCPSGESTTFEKPTNNVQQTTSTLQSDAQEPSSYRPKGFGATIAREIVRDFSEDLAAALKPKILEALKPTMLLAMASEAFKKGMKSFESSDYEEALVYFAFGLHAYDESGLKDNALNGNTLSYISGFTLIAASSIGQDDIAIRAWERLCLATAESKTPNSQFLEATLAPVAAQSYLFEGNASKALMLVKSSLSATNLIPELANDPGWIAETCNTGVEAASALGLKSDIRNLLACMAENIRKINDPREYSTLSLLYSIQVADEAASIFHDMRTASSEYTKAIHLANSNAHLAYLIPELNCRLALFYMLDKDYPRATKLARETLRYMDGKNLSESPTNRPIVGTFSESMTRAELIGLLGDRSMVTGDVIGACNMYADALHRLPDDHSRLNVSSNSIAAFLNLLPKPFVMDWPRSALNRKAAQAFIRGHRFAEAQQCLLQAQENAITFITANAPFITRPQLERLLELYLGADELAASISAIDPTSINVGFQIEASQSALKGDLLRSFSLRRLIERSSVPAEDLISAGHLESFLAIERAERLRIELQHLESRRRQIVSDDLNLYNKLIPTPLSADVTVFTGRVVRSRYNQSLDSEELLRAELPTPNGGLPSQCPTTRQIVDAMPKSAGLVQYVRYSPLMRNGMSSNAFAYGAYVVGIDRTVRWVSLGDAKRIDSSIQTAFDVFIDPSLSIKQVKSQASQLYSSIWARLNDGLKGCETIFICSIEDWPKFPFEALIKDAGSNSPRFLVEDFGIAYLNSPRDFLLPEKVRSAKIPAHALIVGDPAFGLTPERRRSSLALASALMENYYKGRIDIAESNFPYGSSGYTLPALPESREMLIGTGGIASSFEKAGISPLVLLGDFALEDIFRQRPLPEYLVVATHGMTGIDSQDVGEIGRLISSRLVLTGGDCSTAIEQNGVNDPSELDDGRLTALEFASLDGSETLVAILAACETDTARKGIFGTSDSIRMAANAAGIPVIVVARWDIPISETTLFLNDFLKRSFDNNSNGDSILKSFRDAQMNALKAARSKWHCGAPYYWAGMSIYGNSRWIKQ